jgi:hypothetical protein
MDFSTRSELYDIASKHLKEQCSNENIASDISAIFQSTKNAIAVFEKTLNEKKESSSKLFWKNYEDVTKQLPDGLRNYLNAEFNLKEMSTLEVKTNRVKTYNQLFVSYLNCVADFQNKVIQEKFGAINNYDFFSARKRKQVFLSYAYDDRALSLALFVYFAFNDIFLYVDWMQSGKNKTGKLTKEKLEKELKNSNQLLFLRTALSELHIPGGYSIRQWCAWEIGNFYAKRSNEKYIISFYENELIDNLFLDTFKIMDGIKDGRIC